MQMDGVRKALTYCKTNQHSLTSHESIHAGNFGTIIHLGNG
jgi:hypothetical protein